MLMEARFTGHRKGLTTPARAAYSAPIWKSQQVKRLPTEKISNFFLMACRNQLIWIWILRTGLCIGPIAAIRPVAIPLVVHQWIRRQVLALSLRLFLPT